MLELFRLGGFSLAGVLSVSLTAIAGTTIQLQVGSTMSFVAGSDVTVSCGAGGLAQAAVLCTVRKDPQGSGAQVVQTLLTPGAPDALSILETYTSLDAAVEKLGKLRANGLCPNPGAKVACIVEPVENKSGGRTYMVVQLMPTGSGSIKKVAIATGYKNMDYALDKLKSLKGDGICENPSSAISSTASGNQPGVAK